jgi:hypothetical protein
MANVNFIHSVTQPRKMDDQQKRFGLVLGCLVLRGINAIVVSLLNTHSTRLCCHQDKFESQDQEFHEQYRIPCWRNWSFAIYTHARLQHTQNSCSAYDVGTPTGTVLCVVHAQDYRVDPCQNDNNLLGSYNKHYQT